jgi:hypothetical protein
MSQIPARLARFSVTDERARTTLQMLSQTVMAGVVWVVSWRWVAPLLGVQVLDPGEIVQAMSSFAAATTLPGVEPSRTLTEIMAGFFLWMAPGFVALFGVATISAALWYVVGRLIEPSAAAETEGESA